jgi:protein tyrosine phosphatase (PTP) superfamily phosphohydrolase (DUF442 family)
MEETKLEKLARLSGKATSKALDALGKRGFDIRGKLSTPISRVPRPGSSTEAKIERVMADPETIYNWRRLDDRVTTSGQPTEPQLADIQALGVRHIINLGLHTHEKALPDEAASVSRLGMTYIHIPVDFQNPTDEDFTRFCSAMEQLKEVPVHVHCIANYRVSAFFYRYRRDVLGVDETQARAEMDQIWRPEGVWATFVGR